MADPATGRSHNHGKQRKDSDKKSYTRTERRHTESQQTVWARRTKDPRRRSVHGLDAPSEDGFSFLLNGTDLMFDILSRAKEDRLSVFVSHLNHAKFSFHTLSLFLKHLLST